MSATVLVLNSGSSSVKFALYDPEREQELLSGIAERVGTPRASATIRLPGGERELTDLGDGDHQAVLSRVLSGLGDWLDEQGHHIAAVGHRLVHGGERFHSSVVLDEETLAAVRDCIPLAPLHNPANIAGVEAAQQVLPEVPQVGVFDTAFHQTMPAHAYRYAVPPEWYSDLGVRRYGFHGTSHRYVSQRAAEFLDRPLAELRMITAHLGNGCSLTAIRDGVSVDTSMGLTPLEGVVMGTRSGDVDPGVPGYVQDRTGAELEQITLDLNKRSGLLGLSGVSNDMREIRAAADDGDPDARLALEVFGYRLAKYIAALAVATEGVDVLVFTGGIGENDTQIRAEVLQRLGFLGLRLDSGANDALRGEPGVITTEDSPVTALVIPTDEELVIAQDAHQLTTEADR
ncbi:acetate kinase [Enemella evansiae]|uniref:acetate/propionate family kinase n=1 Tax=Enemella evansiae TaxID=2016499 RepID=UPI000B97B548|nr:acetate kinase [Enemella evansiae]OYO10835.1 acetate kinase [Enemella evansiae]